MVVFRPLLLALLLALTAAAPASAVTYTVDVATDDPADITCGAGSCPLSAAIDDANNDGTTSDIVFTVPTVTSPGGFQTAITQPLTIDGDQGGTKTELLGPDLGTGVGLDFQVAGGVASTARNLVIGDFAYGIHQNGTAPLVIQGSLIGISATNVDRSNGSVGIYADGGGRITVGGTVAAQRNVIANNGTDIQVASGPNHVVEGNYIGTTVDGLAATSGNSSTGILLNGAIGGARIGGATAASRNVITTTSIGVYLAGSAVNTTVQNNYVGLDSSGTSAIGSGSGGILLQGVDGNQIRDNVVSGWSGHGIRVESGSSDNLIQGNSVGTLANGTGDTSTGNKQGGIFVGGPDSTGNKIGGTGAGEGNLVAHNGLSSWGGILLTNDSRTELSGNRLDDNVGNAPIDLGSNDVADANDEGDPDTNADNFGFANNMQNHPVIATATGGAGGTTVGGTLDSLPSHTYRIEFFGGPACATSGSNETEAQNFLGFTTVSTNGFGVATFGNVTLPAFSGVGVRATAIDTTLTDPTTIGDTSELSPCVSKTAATADVSLGITHAPATVQAGNPVTFSFLVSNAGPSTANGTLSGTIGGANVSSVSPPPGIDCSASSGNTISCSGAVPAGGAGTVAVTAVPATAGTATADGTTSAVEDSTPGNNSAIDSVTVTAAPGPVQTPLPSDPTPGPSEPPPPEPDVGESVAVAPEQGTVLVKRPGSDEYVPLTAGEEIPLGTVVDARKGRVALTSESADGTKQTADFYQGRFKVTQQSSGLTELALQGPLCKASRSAVGEPLAQSAAKRKKRRSRRTTRKLWGDGSGDFRTRGRYGTATVQGTRWLTEDRCDGTNVKVAKGTVQVRDLVKKKNVTVKAPRSYLARSKR